MRTLSKLLRTSYLASAVMISFSGGVLSRAGAEEIAIGAEANKSTELVFYSGNLGQVSQTRISKLSQGESTLALEDVSPHLILDSLFLEGKGLRIREQRLDQEILSPQRLLDASLGKTITIVKTNPETGEETSLEAEVLAVREGLVLRVGDKIETKLRGRLVYDSIPEGLRSGPTLLAVVESEESGEQDLHLTYLTSSMDWRVTYVAELNPRGTTLSLKAMATLTNQTGVDFEEAQVRLVSGNVNQVIPASVRKETMMSMYGGGAVQDMPQRQSVADRDVYVLTGTVDIGGMETKQVTLLENSAVEVEKRFRFQQLIQPYAGRDETGRQQAEIVLKSKNTKAKGLGQALPEGTLRVYQQTKGEASSIFMGEDALQAVPVGEDLELVIGSANQVTGRGKQTSYENLSRNSYQLTQEITLRNSGDTDVWVDVVGHLPGNWKILEESKKHVKESSRKIIWSIEIPAKGKSTFDYKLRVSHE